MVGMMVGGVLGGAAIVETIFGRQGVGQLFVEAVRAHDFPLIQALIILTGGVFVRVTLAVDPLYPLIDPRVVAAYRCAPDRQAAPGAEAEGGRRAARTRSRGAGGRPNTTGAGPGGGACRAA